MSDLPLIIFFEVGYTSISMAELAGISLFDIILMDFNSSLQEMKLKIRVGPEFFYDGRIDSTGKIIVEEKSVPFTEKNMEENEFLKEDEQVSEQTMKIQEIPVQLVFQMGETQLTYGELSRIQPGYIFETRINPEKPVTIKANGKPIGEGELVEIGGRIGLRVLTIDGHGSIATE
jgi:type III secretion protein Q